jgi:steroid 5-alpha reductase family enzyme
MKDFKRRPENHGQVCRVGLWAWSRHPNYFFEFLGWAAYPVIAIDAANPWSYLSLVSPIVMYLVVRYATGIPHLEAAMARAKGDVYRRYQAEVSMLLLLPPGTGRMDRSRQ